MNLTLLILYNNRNKLREVICISESIVSIVFTSFISRSGQCLILV